MLTVEELPPCPVATTIRLISSKWKIFILQRLLDRPYGFGELRRSIEGVSEKVLADSLKQMEADGIVSRAVIPETPIRTEYSLTELGESMRPIIISMQEWGLEYQRIVREG